jgi:hypothetical protein
MERFKAGPFGECAPYRQPFRQRILLTPEYMPRLSAAFGLGKTQPER